MAHASSKKRRAKRRRGRFSLGVARAVTWLKRGVLGLAVSMLLWIVAYAVVPIPTTPYMISERLRIGVPLERQWAPIEEIAPELQRAVIAAEDANFCLHWGFDMDAIRAAIADGARRGGSTVSQQTVKNAFLWHGRSWFRKALEAVITPAVELVWTKRRLLEVYLNIAEFDTGVFGAEAAAQHYFGVSASDLSTNQAARLAAILPNPQERSASNPSNATRSRAARIADGAATIRADGRDDCFAN